MRALRFGDYRIRTKLLIYVTAIVAATLASSAWIYHQRNVLAEADHWTEHTYQVLDEISGAMEGALNQRGGLRGYVISQDRSQILAFRNAQARFATNMARLKLLTADNPLQQRRLGEIETILDRWKTDVAEPTLQLMSNESTRAEALDAERRAIGNPAFNKMQEAMQEVIATEHQLLSAREQAKTEARDQITFAILAGGSVIVLVSVAAGSCLYAPSRGHSRV